MKNVLVTGVSTGLGHAMAERLLNEGYFVIGTILEEGDAADLAAKFADRFMPVVLDITDYASVDKVAEQVAKKLNGAGLFALVNNAGVSRDGPLKYVSMDDIEHVFQVNVFGTMKVTKAFLPLLGAEFDSPVPAGRIINMSSGLALIRIPFSGIYTATKCALEAFSDVLRAELKIYGISVVTINPGPVKTPIWKNQQKQAEARAKTDYANYRHILQPKSGEGRKDGRGGRMLLTPDAVADVLMDILESDNPKPTNIVMKLGRVGLWLVRLLPKRLQDRVFSLRKKPIQ